MQAQLDKKAEAIRAKELERQFAADRLDVTMPSRPPRAALAPLQQCTRPPLPRSLLPGAGRGSVPDLDRGRKSATVRGEGIASRVVY